MPVYIFLFKKVLQIIIHVKTATRSENAANPAAKQNLVHFEAKATHFMVLTAENLYSPK